MTELTTLFKVIYLAEVRKEELMNDKFEWNYVSFPRVNVNLEV